MFNYKKNQGWTSQKFIELSQLLGEAYLPGLSTSKSNAKEDLLTMSNFLAISNNINLKKDSDA